MRIFAAILIFAAWTTTAEPTKGYQIWYRLTGGRSFSLSLKSFAKCVDNSRCCASTLVSLFTSSKPLPYGYSYVFFDGPACTGRISRRGSSRQSNWLFWTHIVFNRGCFCIRSAYT
ncbi:hypothetical protein BCR33DRAFT_244784 [Rhizoclosmatium globosum]|uniref:Uncharacterized protein n=1 Tax=Rhizoclosmatium globosum TaxID=329046 RepID=A0A1Y2C9A1_9FUNG|nr:hypothetical protein BCR33DRAFT_244784 [Rhizoclosmatium globosum]|eukprot:ORY43599.1 hypothetical protein BCR33DRAFT_244784 [Rhizoclosmatium globosum]